MWSPRGFENAACILMSENPVARDRQRHVDVKFHFLRERVRLGELRLIKCHGPHNVADAFTKALAKGPFEAMRAKLLHLCTNSAAAKG